VQARRKVYNYPMPGNPSKYVACTTQGAFPQVGIMPPCHSLVLVIPAVMVHAPLVYALSGAGKGLDHSLPVCVSAWIPLQPCNTGLKWNQKLQDCTR
jgi:hypothetical protein